MKKLAFSLLAATLFFAACSKDDDKKIDNASSLTYNGEAISTPYGYRIDYTDGSTFVAADKDLLSTAGYTGTATAVAIDVDTVILGQTYTFKNYDSTGYDKAKNFAYAATYFKQPYAGRDFTDEATSLDTLTGGSVTINKTQNTYKVTYELQYHNITVKGEYNGDMTVIND
ncbi:hypothetical protein [Chitinophaga sp. S165]|uniref:hypothetical protein n=1 Tax=Chitinophaga sp. S165 TaxID=2135462 RepID=UPI000D70FE84|nr:hypothetical protein [Chitinophaga sp. S165]PWV49626.1 hypothetical protein C7475_105134 [Chitinophaga sp. S165]